MLTAQRTIPDDKRRRPYPNGRFLLVLDDQGDGDVGLIHSVDGGQFQSEAIGEKVGAERLETRYPGRQRFDDIVVEVGTTMSGRFWRWVKSSLGDRPERMNGAILALDTDGYERSRRTFYDALIAEVRFPALDAGSKQAAHLTIRIAPERVEWDNRGAPPRRATTGAIAQQVSWKCCNFRFRVDGLGEQMWAVQKVDGFAVKQNIINNPVGHERYVRKEPGRIEYPNFSFHIPESHAAGWIAHWKRFVGDGKHSADAERGGVLEYLANDASKTLLSVRFEGIGVTGVAFDKHEASSDKLRSVKVDLYCEALSVRKDG